MASKAKRETVAAMNARLQDAYSTGRYGGKWGGCIRALRAAGYDDRQIEAIIRSKWTRWAGDGAGAENGKHTAKHLMSFLDEMKYTPDSEGVKQLIKETVFLDTPAIG